MRVIKLAKDVFTTLDEADSYEADHDHDGWKPDVAYYFDVYLGGQTPRGKFRFPCGKIAKDGLDPCEPIVFTYDATVVYKARAKTGRLVNDDRYRDDYGCYLVIDLHTLCRTKPFKVGDLEELLKEAGFRKALKGAGFPRYLDDSQDDRLEEIWRSLECDYFPYRPRRGCSDP